MSTPNFVIVTFVDEDDAPGIVAANWIKSDNNTCFYPNVRTEEMKNKLLRKMAEPEDIWSQHQIKILKKYESYSEARLHLKKAEETSNLDSEDEVRKRKRKRNKIYLPEDSDSSDDYPITKVAKAQQTLQEKKKDFSKYPTPPKPKPVAKQNTLDDEGDIVEVTNNVVMDVNSVVHCPPGPSSVTTVPPGSNQAEKSQSCPNKAVSCPSGCIISKQFAIKQSHLIQMVTDMSNQMAELNRKVDLLLVNKRRSGESFTTQIEDPFAVPDFLTILPVKDDASFCNLNDELKISQNKQAIIKYLAGIGGRNVRSFTTNMLRRILLDEVAEMYSLSGKQMKNSTKKPFLTTEICKIIFQICKKVYDDVTEQNLKEIIRDWLNQAKVRITRRTERQKNTVLSDAVSE